MEDTLTLEQINDIEDAQEKTAKLLEYAKAQEEAKRKLEADTDRGIKKVLDEKKYLELITSEAKVLMKDKNYFTTLLDKDEWLAKAVLNEFFDWTSIEDALAQVDDKLVEEHKAKTKERNIEETVKELFTKKEVELKLSRFIQEAWLSKEDKTAFDNEFKDLTEWKKLNESNIDKYLRLAFKEVLPDVDYRKVEQDAKDMAISIGSQSQSKQVQHNARKSNIEYLKTQWFF